MIILDNLCFVADDEDLFQVMIVTMMAKWLQLKIVITSLYRWAEWLLVS
jgi:hypothetical protein